MIDLNPLERRELEQQKWLQATWNSIEPQDLIAVILKDGTVAVGTMDDYTSDRSVFWLRLSRTNERRCFLLSETDGAWFPPHA